MLKQAPFILGSFFHLSLCLSFSVSSCLIVFVEVTCVEEVGSSVAKFGRLLRLEVRNLAIKTDTVKGGSRSSISR